MLQAQHKSGNGTVVLKEGGTGYLVTVHQEALPPHYSREFVYYEDALSKFAEMTVRFDSEEIAEITNALNEEIDPAATVSEVTVALMEMPADIDDIEDAVSWIARTAY